MILQKLLQVAFFFKLMWQPVQYKIWSDSVMQRMKPVSLVYIIGHSLIYCVHVCVYHLQLPIDSKHGRLNYIKNLNLSHVEYGRIDGKGEMLEKCNTEIVEEKAN